MLNARLHSLFLIYVINVSETSEKEKIKVICRICNTYSL